MNSEKQERIWERTLYRCIGMQVSANKVIGRYLKSKRDIQSSEQRSAGYVYMATLTRLISCVPTHPPIENSKDENETSLLDAELSSEKN
jgi:hypothetical protein